MKPPRKLLDRAYRARAGMQGLLLSCTCTYPLERHDNATGHAEDCPAFVQALTMRDLVEGAGDLLAGRVPSQFSLWVEKGGWWARCRECGGVIAASSIPQLAELMVGEHLHEPAAAPPPLPAGAP